MRFLKGLRVPGLQGSLAVKAFVCSFERVWKSLQHVEVLQLLKAFLWREACSPELWEPSRNAAVAEDMLQIWAARGCPDLKDASSESCIS